MFSSLVTVEEGLVGEGARRVAGEQDQCCRLANGSVRKIGSGIVGRCIHIDLNAGQSAASAGGRRVTHCHLNVHGCCEALVVVVVHQQFVAYEGVNKSLAITITLATRATLTRYAVARAEHNVVLRMLHFVQSIELGVRIEGHITILVRHRLNGRVIQITGTLRRRLQLRLRL